MATVTELVQHTRFAILRDGAAPSLWTDAEIIQYLAEAERIFARKTHCLVEDSGSRAQLQTSSGVKAYALDPSVVHVYEVTDDTGRPLRDSSRAQMPKVFAPGKPRAYTTARGSHKITFAPAPDDEYTYEMLVAVLPEVSLVDKYDDDEPDIDEDYHYHLCQYAAYKALLNNDPEGSNTVAAAEFFATWQQALREAKRDVFRLRVPSGAHVRNNWAAARRG